MTIAPVRFSSSLVIDSGGTGLRIDFSTEDGQMYPDTSDKFWGAANVSYSEVDKKGPLTPETVFNTLVDGFVSKRLNSEKTYVHQGEHKTVAQILKEDPIKRVFVATAGQIQQDSTQGFPFITAADNVKKAMQNMDFLSSFRQALLERLVREKMGELVDKPSFAQKGWMFNDALAGVMALAKHLESSNKAPLKEEDPNYIFLDVGSGIATGGIDGNQLYTAESQNTNIWFMPKALQKPGEEPLVEAGTFEDFGSMRGMTQQTVRQLRQLSLADRVQHPVYQAMRKAALEKDGHKAEPQYQNNPKAFDTTFDESPVKELQNLAWQEKWLNFDSILLPIYLKDKTDPVAGPVVDQALDALAALAAVKVMEHKAKKVFLQFIDMDFATRHVNQERAKDTPAMENPLAGEVNRRMWEKFLHQGIAKTCFDREGVVVSNLRNPDGIGYLSESMKPDRAQSWKIKGIPSAKLKSVV